MTTRTTSRLKKLKYVPATAKKRETPLSEPELELLRYVLACITEGFPPSWQEMKTHMGYSSLNSITAIVDALVAKGYLRMRAGVPRGIKIVGVSFLPVYSADEAGKRLLTALNPPAQDVPS